MGESKKVWFFVAILFLIVVGFGLLIYQFVTKTSADPELMMGTVVVFSIATLMTILFILAAGFTSMSLADPKQALGLPEGSIRAMIALVLIMVFIIFGIFLFRKVGTSNSTFLGEVKNTSDVIVPKDTLVIFVAQPPAQKPADQKPGDQKEVPQKYDAFLVEPTSDEGKRLAQQLITTVGTLVVAIASFYFGASMASPKKEPEGGLGAQAITVVSNPVIKDIKPKEGRKGQLTPMEIEGTGFKAPRAVQLMRGSEVMAGTEILSNSTKIQCNVMVDKEPGDKWDVIVVNEDTKPARLDKVFTIMQS
jgi:hypothetical protein